jgi:hypothetical protein
VGAIPSSIGTGGDIQEEMLREIAEDEGISTEVEGRKANFSGENQRGEQSICSKQAQSVNGSELELRDRSEGQSLEDTDTGRTDVNSGPIFPQRDACSVSPGNDNPPKEHITLRDACRNRDSQEAADLSQRNLDKADPKQVFTEGTRTAAQDHWDIRVDRRNLDVESRVVERSERATVGTRQRVTDDQGRERFHLETQNPGDLREDLTEQGQSFEYSDNQGGKSRSAMSKSEGQLLEDVKAGGL